MKALTAKVPKIPKKKLEIKGGARYDDALSEYYEKMPAAHKDYLKNLFYKEMKASGGQRQLYERMMVDTIKPSPHPSWREVRAWHSAQRGNQLSRPAKKQSQSLATVVVRANLAPCARLGFDTVVMQGATANDNTRMSDAGYKGFVNIVDQATRMSWVNLVKTIGDSRQAGQAAIKMIRAVRESYYNDADSDQWPVPKSLPL
eukprot:COSAG01_NODE_858_length_13069_cov_23.641943_18_plen_202_part_00